MRLRVLLEPRYGATYQQILAMARAAEAKAWLPVISTTTAWSIYTWPTT